MNISLILSAKGIPKNPRCSLSYQVSTDPKPDYGSHYNIDDNEIQSNIKRNYERIKLHIHLIFGKLFLPESQRFGY